MTECLGAVLKRRCASVPLLFVLCVLFGLLVLLQACGKSGQVEEAENAEKVQKAQKAQKAQKVEMVEETSAGYAGADAIGSFCERLPREAYAQFEKHAASNDWFEVYEVAAGVWALYEPFQWQEVISYLIAGRDSAVLFDTGNGIGRLRPVVEQLTELPVRVVNSHSHFDHIGGNHEFDEILSVGTPFSREKSRGARSGQISREVSPQALCRGLPDGVSARDHVIRPFPISATIDDGDLLDLGDRQLEVLRIPGHTDDSIALLDREAGLLWVGDSFYEGPIWLFFPETDLAAYRGSVARLAALASDLNAVYPAHNTPVADPALLGALRDSLEMVLSGEKTPGAADDGNVEFRFRDFSFLMREDYYRLDDH